MANQKIPTSDMDRSRFLETAASTARSDQANNLYYLSEATVTAVESMAAQFSAQRTAVQEAKTQKQIRREVRNQAHTVLNRVLKDFWAVAKRQASREQYPNHVLSYYGLPASGRNPKLFRVEAALAHGQTAVDGAAQAAAAGYQPVRNPSAAELQSALDAAAAAHPAFLEAERTLDEAQEQLADQRAQVNSLIRQVSGELRLNLRERPAASRRRVMQAYGAVFIYEANDLPEEDEADWTGEEQAAEALADNPLAAEMMTMSTMIPTLEPANGENELALAGAGSSNGSLN